MSTIKGPGDAQKHDGTDLRIGIVHARWNASKAPLLLLLLLLPTPPFQFIPRFLLKPKNNNNSKPLSQSKHKLTKSTTAIIDPLLAGAKATLLASGVKESNIIVQSVPGSWELPIACSK